MTTIDFHFCILQKCCTTRILKENEGTPDTSPRFEIGKPMLMSPYADVTYNLYAQEIGSKSVAAMCLND